MVQNCFVPKAGYSNFPIGKIEYRDMVSKTEFGSIIAKLSIHENGFFSFGDLFFSNAVPKKRFGVPKS